MMTNLSIPFISKCFYAFEHFNHTSKNILLNFADEESALKAYKQLQFYFKGADNEDDLLFFPSLDTVPYDRVSPSGDIQSARARVLTVLSQSISPKLVVTSAQNMMIRVPPPMIFSLNTLDIKLGDNLGLEEIAIFLVKSGFSRAANAIDSGEFAIRGEILDIVSSENEAYRINFGWEGIESIKEYDVNTQISSMPVRSISLSTASESLLSAKSILTFKNNFLQLFGVNHTNAPIYESIIAGHKFQGYEHLMPLFFDELATLLDYFEDVQVIYDNLSLHSMNECEASYKDFYQSRQETNNINPDSYYYAIPVEMHIETPGEVKAKLEQGDNIFIEGSVGSKEEKSKYASIEKIESLAAKNKKAVFDQLFETIIEHKKRIPVIFCGSKSGRERIRSMAEEREYVCKDIVSLKNAKKNIINLVIAPLSNGFYSDKFLFISEQDILGEKFTSLSHKSSKRKLKNILTEIDNIDEGELIVHKEHGIGRFDKIETIVVDETPHDCLKIIYAENDILYLPVENIDLIKKYGTDEAQLDKLGGASWQRRTAKLKKRIKDIAEKLMKITAERALAKTDPIHFDPISYEKFVSRFPYNETNDQLAAVEDVREDLNSGKLMDRLICGDVGFGKTEVAMRAAFMVAGEVGSEPAQVAIISPTTILCKQHFETFKERFRDMGMNIVQLSRLVKSSQMRENKKAIEEGKANIIIGTHALLAKDIKFKNLKLLIIDEEQHFGVAQKERLKELKSGIHVMSLSATPIPRTLQMSMVGIKDLSLIATAPIDRLPVRTSVLPFDPVVIRDALMRERFRGGRSFYVCPRIKDIEWVEGKLKEIVPELKVKVAHGQMAPGAIDAIMSEFCDGKFDILLSTTIIESGIDIPATNTIIIHRSDMLGLSQLYQLRGRVGRGKVRGYAYLTLPPKIITKHGMARLEVLQNIDSLGAGFTIASHDMDLRGFGNLVGEEQSGHIREVGTELYQDMLDEAIASLKASKDGEEQDQGFTPNINIGIPVYIPELYVEDSALRLALYRRIGDLKDTKEIEQFKDEMVDRFGAIPPEFQNLLEIVQVKHICQELGIENLDSGPNGFVIKFNKNYDVSEKVMAFVKTRPRHAKIKPDSKLVIVHKTDPNMVLEDVRGILSDLGGNLNEVQNI